MLNAINRLSQAYQYPRQAEKDRARMIVVVVIFIMSVFTIYAALLPQGTLNVTIFRNAFVNGDLYVLLALIGMYGTCIGAIILTRRGRLDLSVYAPAVMWMLSAVMLSFREGFSGTDDTIMLGILVVLGTIFPRENGLRLFTAIALIGFWIGAARYNILNNNQGIPLDDGVSVTLQILGVSSILYYFLRNSRISELESTGEISEERVKLATLTTQISSDVLRRTELSDTLNSTVTVIRDQYPKAYHVQIFLLDESRRTARLAASTGEVGKLLLERQHSLPVGSVSVIGQVTSSGAPIVSRAGSTETVHRRNEFLPETVVEAAFPLRIGGLVIGALDMQSKTDEAFREGDLPIFQSMADQIAIAIDNARLFEQIETRAKENQQLAEQANAALREVERLNRQLTEQSWADYIADQGENPGLTYDVQVDVMRKRAEWTPTLTEAMRVNEIVQTPTSDGLTLTVPIAVRGQVIGAMEFELEGDDALSPEDVELVTAVSERLGLAVEGARLYEESRRAAQREAALNTISSRLQATNTVNTVLTEAARGLQESLGANKVAIRLGAPPKPARKTNGAGSNAGKRGGTNTDRDGE
jgi:GAF domain-containing protein